MYTPKWTTARHQGLRDSSLNTGLQSFDSPMAMQDSLDTSIRHTCDDTLAIFMIFHDDHPYKRPKNSCSWTLDRPGICFVVVVSYLDGDFQPQGAYE